MTRSVCSHPCSSFWMLRVQECLQELKAKPWAGWHKYIRVSLYPMSERKRAGEMCKVSQGSGTALQSCAEEGAGDAGGYLGQSQWWDVISIWHHRVFCVGFRDYLWFQGKHNWKECRPRQLHVSWDSYTEKFFPFTLWSLRPGPDRALMKTMPKSQVHFSDWHMDVLFYLQTLTDNAEHM